MEKGINNDIRGLNKQETPDMTLKDLKNVYTEGLQSLKKLEKVKQIKSNQLENSQNLLNELQGNLLQINQSIKKRHAELEEHPESKQQKVKDFIKDRDLKELDKKLEEKLLELSRKRAPLLPVKPVSLEDYKKDDLLMKVHSVKILYMKGVKDGEVHKKDRSNALEMTVRLLKTTTFTDLKKFACEFWDLEEGIYSLRAYNYALIEYITDNVEDFIKNQRMRPELWLIEKNVNSVKCMTEPRDYFTEDSSKHTNRNKDNKNQIDLEFKKNNYKKFLSTFEGARYIMPEESKIDENHELNRLESWELNIFTMLVTLVLFVLTVALHYSFGDFSSRHWIAHQMTQSLKNSMSERGLTYQTISTLDDVASFMKGPVKDVYFQNENQTNPFTNQFVAVGKMKVRYLETKEIDCKYEVLGINNPRCFEGIYDKSTRNELGTGEDKVFKTAGQNNIDTVIQGEFSTYDGSGFTWDFFNYESEDYELKVSNNDNLLNSQLRAIIVTFTHYSPNYDYWMLTQIVIEISVYGSIYVNDVYPLVFRPNLEVKEYQFYLAIFCIRGIVSLYFLFYYFYYGFSKNKMNEKNIWYLYSIGGMYDVLLVILSFTALGYAFDIRGDEQSYLKSSKFKDFTLLASNYNNAILLNAWAAVPICVRFFNCFTINRSIYIMKLNIDLAVKSILTYLVLVTSLYIGFMFVAWNVWGPYYYYYRKLSYTLIHNLLFTIGFGNTTLLIKLNLFWTILFYMLYLNFAIFILVCGFVGIFMESYRQIKLTHGYRDHIKVWAFVDYVVWLLGCMNQKRLRQKIEEVVKKKKIKEEERNKREAEKKEENAKMKKREENEHEEEKSEKSATDRD
jgi:hypothetical protein